jgi:hypothetical protein
MTCIGPTLNKSKEKGGPEAAFFLSCMKIGSEVVLDAEADFVT